MSSFSERWKAIRDAWAKAQARRTWKQMMRRSRDALAAATAPLRELAESERQRLDAIRRRQKAREDQADAHATGSDGSADDDPR